MWPLRLQREQLGVDELIDGGDPAGSRGSESRGSRRHLGGSSGDATGVVCEARGNLSEMGSLRQLASTSQCAGVCA